MLQENLRQLCVFKLANESGVPWKWWEYVTRFGDECKMSENQYNEECAERVSSIHDQYSIASFSLINRCRGGMQVACLQLHVGRKW
jgi:hypothetical protein